MGHVRVPTLGEEGTPIALECAIQQGGALLLVASRERIQTACHLVLEETGVPAPAAQIQPVGIALAQHVARARARWEMRLEGCGLFQPMHRPIIQAHEEVVRENSRDGAASLLQLLDERLGPGIAKGHGREDDSRQPTARRSVQTRRQLRAQADVGRQHPNELADLVLRERELRRRDVHLRLSKAGRRGQRDRPPRDEKHGRSRRHGSDQACQDFEGRWTLRHVVGVVEGQDDRFAIRHRRTERPNRVEGWGPFDLGAGDRQLQGFAKRAQQIRGVLRPCVQNDAKHGGVELGLQEVEERRLATPRGSVDPGQARFGAFGKALDEAPSRKQDSLFGHVQAPRGRAPPCAPTLRRS